MEKRAASVSSAARLEWLVSRVLSSRPIARKRARRSFIWAVRYRAARAAYPGARAGNPRTPLYAALLRMGFAVPRSLPIARWALTPPFHPYPDDRDPPGGLFSVALSSRSPSPGVTRHPALWSPDFPPAAARSAAASDHQIHSSGASIARRHAAESSEISMPVRVARSVMCVFSFLFARASSWRARSRDTPRRRPISASDIASSSSAMSRFSTM